MERNCIKTWIDNQWKSKVVVKFIPKGFFIVIFAEEDEKERILHHGNWFLDGHPLYLQPWFPNFDLVPLVVYDRPIWICLYWGESNLEKIGRTLGTLLEIDENIVENDSYLYARLITEAVKEIRSHIYIKSMNRIWSRLLEVEEVRL
ncbi:hypothetical protein SUGI_1136400 [Cryptomeria japonica]|nr:hypothetical protein SUGI_1136400 [Cryptomeria japonica]